MRVLSSVPGWRPWACASASHRTARTHTHSIFCLLSLTPDSTNTMRFCSGFILSIWTRRHLVQTQPTGEGKKPQPPKTPSEPPRGKTTSACSWLSRWTSECWWLSRSPQRAIQHEEGRKEGRKQSPNWAKGKQRQHARGETRAPNWRRYNIIKFNDNVTIIIKFYSSFKTLFFLTCLPF